jgi:hypothetical protein
MSPFQGHFHQGLGQLRRGLGTRGVLDELDGAHGAEAFTSPTQLRFEGLDLIAAVEDDLADGIGAVAELSSSIASSTAWAAAQATGLPA